MIKYIYGICLFCLLSSTLQAQTSRKKVVEYPGFVTASTGEIEIKKIILTDEQTQVDAVMYGSPGTPAVISSKTYLKTEKGTAILREAASVSIDGTTPPGLIPECGYLNVILSFSPVPSGVHELDFVEPEAGWMIWDVQLSREEPYVYVPAFLTADKPKRTGELPEPVFGTGRAIVNGYMLGYEPDMELSVEIEYNDGIFPSLWKEKVNVRQDGSFHFEADLIQPTLAVMRVNGAEQRMLLVPDDEFTMYVSLPRLCMSASHLLKEVYAKTQKIWFDGAAELVNTELARGVSRALKSYQAVESKLMHNDMMAGKIQSDIKLAGPICERLLASGQLLPSDKKKLEELEIEEIRNYILRKGNVLHTRAEQRASMEEAVVALLDGKVSGSDILPSIISSYKGHAVLIDFWATWCGPCKKSMKAMMPLKKKLADKEVVYVYLTGQSSPENRWKTDLADMTGVHYRLTDEQWKYLCSTYGITGVPAYLVISHDGKLQRRYVGFPGADELEKELLRAIGE